MRLRVERIALVGTSREPRFQPGVNIVLGPITTGKSTLMKLLRVLLGSGVPALPPEVRDNVTALAGEMLVGDRRVSVVRPLVTTTTAKVDLATDEGEALRLPALKGDRTAPTTYGRWLLANLGLPDLTVAAAPTRPEESDPTSVSINDYLRYCQLTQEEIDTSVFGSNHPQRNIKRQYVFRILYGLSTPGWRRSRRSYVASRPNSGSSTPEPIRFAASSKTPRGRTERRSNSSA